MSVTVRTLVSLVILGYVATEEIQITVHWTNENGTRLELPAQRFAEMAEHERADNLDREKRHAVKNWKYLWHMGTVYYDIDARTADFRLLQILGPAFEFFKKYTCIRWKRKLPEDFSVKDYVIFSMPQSGVSLCNSAVGKQSGRQYINLDTECVKSLAKVLHHMTHALGFYHVHSRPDRDQYVTIHTENALPQYRKFFDKTPESLADSMGFPYEHKSLMHFNGYQYSSGYNPTIVSKVPGLMLGNNQALTVQDITMINTLYAQCQRSCRFANGNCEHTCTDRSPGVVDCSCMKGFRLNPDGKTCYDVDECSIYNGGCDHTCVKHGSWYRCECNKHFSLDKDGYSCRANDQCEVGSLHCEQQCLFNTCGCRDGFTLNSDGRTCDDVDECALRNGGCEQSCYNTHGSFQCDCSKGSFLSNDGKSCTELLCPTLAQVPNAVLNCTNNASVEGTVCRYSCKRGYKLVGQEELKCSNTNWDVNPPICIETDRCQLDNGGCEQLCWANSWDDVKCSCRRGFQLQSDGLHCADIEPPTIITCPQNIYTNTVPKKSYSSVTWDLPTYYDNTEAYITSGPVMQDKIGGVFDIGAHLVEYIITDSAGNNASCSFKIKVNDVEKPDMFNCPGFKSIHVQPLQKYIEADWEDPGFWDNSGVEVKVTTDLPDNRLLQPISQDIHYIATDPSGNNVVCTVSVIVATNTQRCDVFPYKLQGGQVKCDKFVFGTQCRLLCDNDYDLTLSGVADIYSCYHKQWVPKPQKLKCPAKESPIQAPILYYELTYKTSCVAAEMPRFVPVATATANKYKELLCLTVGASCKLTAKLECKKDYIVLRVDTSESLQSPLPNGYLDSLKNNIKQRASGLFFYMPIGGTILAPQKDTTGFRVKPKLDFACRQGAITDFDQLSCYRRP